MIEECEVKVGGEWATVDHATAVALYLHDLKRCPACGGRVTHYQGGKNHFGYYTAHTGCPLAWNFSGTASPHPDAIRD